MTTPGSFGYLGAAGWLTVVGGFLDLGVTVFPPRLGNPFWEFGVAAQVVASMVPVVLGLTVTLFVAERTGSRTGMLTGALCAVIGLVGLVVLLALGALSVPLVLEAAGGQSTEARLGATRAMTKSAGLAVLVGLYLVGFLLRVGRSVRSH